MAILALALCILGLASTAAASARPHIILMLADDLAWGDVSYHSSESSAVIQTPNIDALAAEGMILENYYVQPTCTPTRSQLMTARYQIHTGLMHGLIEPPQPSCIPLDEKLLPEYLQDYNYATHMVGKWHLGMYKPSRRPTNRGFDSHFGILNGAGEYYSHNYSYYVKSTNVWLSGKDFRYTNSTDSDDKIQEEYKRLYATELYVNRTKDIISEYANGADASLPPLSMYVAFQTPHKPIEVPDEFVDLYDGGPLTGTRKKYAGMVSSLDNAVGKIVDALKDADIYEDSVIIFSTDNGGAGQPSTNWPLRGAKDTLWEGGIRAVGFVTSPSYIPNCNVGTINWDLIHVSDWLPTIIEGALGETISTPSDPNDELDGVNVWDYFTKCKVRRSIRKEILHNIDPYYLAGRVRNSDYDASGYLIVNDTFDTTMHAALRVGDMKILTGKTGKRKFSGLKEAINMVAQWCHRHMMCKEGSENQEKVTEVIFIGAILAFCLIDIPDQSREYDSGESYAKLLSAALYEPGPMEHDPPPESGIATPSETLDSGQTVQLFNITADPYEEIDLSEAEPDIVIEMVAKLAAYCESSKRASITYPPEEAEADPGLGDGYWGPWRNDDESLI